MSYLDAVGKIESGNNWGAKNKNSTARGRYQITEKTYELLQKKYPKEFGSTSFEEMQKSPAFQNAAMAYLSASNKEDLQRNGIENPTPTQLYMAHHLGSGRAAKLIRAGDNARISDYLSQDELTKNPHLQNKTVANFNQMFGKQLAGATTTPHLANKPPQALPAANQVQVIENIKKQKMLEASQMAAANGMGMQQAYAPSSAFQFTPTANAINANPNVMGQIGQLAVARPGSLQQDRSLQSTTDFARAMIAKYSAPQNGAQLEPIQSAAAGGVIANQEQEHTIEMADGGVVAFAGGDAVPEPWNIKWAQLETSPAAKATPAPQTNQTERGPWEDYQAQASSQAPSQNATPSRGASSAAGDKPSVWQAMKEGFSKALPAAASALNTRPEQVIGTSKYGIPIVRQQTEEEKALGPTTAAKRAARTAGVLQGAVADLPMAIAQMMPGKSAQNVADAQLQGYDDFRKQLLNNENDSLDGGRIVGNIASPLGLKAAKSVDNLLSKTGAGLFKRGAAQGAVAGISQPLTPGANEEGGFLTDKAIQAGAGALLGGSLNKVFSKLPENSVAYQNASEVEKYRQQFPETNLTWGQHLGDRFNRLEQKLASSPFVGDVIKEARNKALLSQNTAMMNKALKPAGIEVPKEVDVKLGGNREMFSDAYQKLQDKLNNDILPNIRLADPQALRAKIIGKMDTGTGKSLATPDQLANSHQPGVITNKYNQLSEAGQQKFDRLLEAGLFSKFGKDAKGNHSLAMTGKQFKTHEEDLKDTIDDLMSGGGEDRMIGKMLKKSLQTAKAHLTGVDGKSAKDLDAWNKAYAGYKILEKASTASSSGGGFFTPAQTIRASQRGNANRGMVAQGKGLLQPEAELSERVLGKAYPDSGTAGRLLANSPSNHMLGAVLSPLAEILYSPKVATNILQGGTKMKNAFSSTDLGKAVQANAPTGITGAIRGLISPHSNANSHLENEEEMPWNQY